MKNINYFKERLCILLMEPISIKTYVLKKSRHIRWNWEKSPNSEELVRYHVVVVDDKGREKIRNQIFEQLQKVSSGIEIIRERESKVIGSKFKYLFSTFDTVLSPEMIDFTKIRKPIKRDFDLVERKRGSVEDYVSSIYE